MPKAKTITTAATMTKEHLPTGRRPEEFLQDKDLVGYYRRQLASMKPSDPKRDEVKRLLKSAKIGAAAVDETDEDAGEQPE